MAEAIGGAHGDQHDKPVGESHHGSEERPAKNVDGHHLAGPKTVSQPARGDLSQGIRPEKSTHENAHLLLRKPQVLANKGFGNADTEAVQVEEDCHQV